MRSLFTLLVPLAVLGLLVGCQSNGAGLGAGLLGTSWTLLDLATEPVGDVEVTLAFGVDGTVSGLAACSRYTGTYTEDGPALSFGPLATTAMACNDRLMEWEQRFLAALAAAWSWEVVGNVLWIRSEGLTAPLRFVPSG